VIAADVFAYCGDLSAYFDAVAQRCPQGAWFAFSTEVSPEVDFLLQRSGRYAHRQGYVEQLLIRCGFAVRFVRRCVLRREGSGQIEGLIFLGERIEATTA